MTVVLAKKTGVLDLAEQNMNIFLANPNHTPTTSYENVSVNFR